MSAPLIEPAWAVFGKCERCGAPEGAPCHDMRGTPRVWLPNRRNGTPLRNPHPKRKKVRN